jgi:ABC-2 type transport system ATP-binding protein
MIALNEVTKEYAGPIARATGSRVRALDAVSLHVEPGTALGIVGPNGAGKSTLIRLLLGYLRPSRGTVRIGGLAPRQFVQRHGMGYVSELVAIPPTWTAGGALRTFASLGGVAHAEERVRQEMERLGIEALAGRRISSLSKGNLQRVALAQAFLAPRKVMILDEPASGLDPEWVIALRDHVAAWRRDDPGRVLLVASHNLDEVERVADRVLVLERGRVREVIDLRQPQSQAAAYRLEVEPGNDVQQVVRTVFPDAVQEDGAPFAYRVEVADVADLNRRAIALMTGGVQLRALVPERQTLEERYRAGRTLPGGEVAP